MSASAKCSEALVHDGVARCVLTAVNVKQVAQVGGRLGAECDVHVGSEPPNSRAHLALILSCEVAA